MAKKKTSSKNTVKLGYVHKFDYNDPTDKKSMGGHPHVGRVYRIIEDNKDAYRLYIGEDNNPLNSAGIFIDSLSGDFPRWSYEIELITEDNYASLDIHDDDISEIQQWLDNPNMSLDKYLDPTKVDISSHIPKLHDTHELSTMDLFEILKNASKLEKDDVAHTVTVEDGVSSEVFDLAIVLERLNEKDPELVMVVKYLVDYLLSTYSDKYESADMPNLSKQILINTELGKGANVFTAFKYIQRYGTVGFEKSANPVDLLKAIHYTMFELQRTKPWDKPKTIKRTKNN